MSKRAEKIRKLFKDTFHTGILLEEGKSTRDIVDYCEGQDKLFIYKGLFIAAVKSSYQNQDCIRMVFVIKESESGKVKDIDKVFELVTDLEEALICLDKCEQHKSDGFIYLDIMKKLIPVD